jgi:micrococcal nuclease
VDDAPAATRTVYVTNTGKKYHPAGCSYLRQSQIAMPLEDAIKRG